MGRKIIDWKKIKKEYVFGNTSLPKLSKKHNVAYSTLSMRANKIEPKSVTFVFNSILDKPWLFLITGKKGGKSGMIVEKPMILRNDDKSYTEEYSRLYE